MILPAFKENMRQRFLLRRGDRKEGVGAKPNLAGFTLLELLMVVAIIGILATVALPNLKSFGKGNAMKAATSQLMDDLAFARQKAMATRSTVYVVFIKDDFLKDPNNIGKLTGCPAPILKQVQDVSTNQLSTYVMLCKRTVGDQPGRKNPRFLTGWRSLPKGVFFAQVNFIPVAKPPVTMNLPGREPINFYPLDYGWFPFPRISQENFELWLPYIAFNSKGEMTSGTGTGGIPDDEYLLLSQGSVMSVNGELLIEEMPRGNSISNYHMIHIDAVTGRAKLERQEIQ